MQLLWSRLLRRFPEAAQPKDRHLFGLSCIFSFCGAHRASQISRSCISCVHIHTARACKGGPRAVGSVKTGQLRGKRSLSCVHDRKLERAYRPRPLLCCLHTCQSKCDWIGEKFTLHDLRCKATCCWPGLNRWRHCASPRPVA